MSEDDEIKRQWTEMLGEMLHKYRADHPEDHRPDRELLTSLMDHFVASGLIEKRGGKYVMKRIAK